MNQSIKETQRIDKKREKIMHVMEYIQNNLDQRLTVDELAEIPLIKEANFEGGFYHKVRVFLDAVKNGDPSPVPSSEIIYNQAIIDGIVKSNKLGREIVVEIPEI